MRGELKQILLFWKKKNTVKWAGGIKAKCHKHEKVSLDNDLGLFGIIVKIIVFSV